MTGQVLHEHLAGSLELRPVHAEPGEPDPERVFLVLLVDCLCLHPLLINGLLVHHGHQFRESP